MLSLPDQFIYGKGEGGGLTYGSASEAVLTAMACSRLKKKSENPVAYTSIQSHFSVVKAAKVLGIPMRLIPGDRDEHGNYPMDPKKLAEQIEADKEKGFEPIFICGCVGTTNVGAIDDLEAIGKIAKNEDCWFHVDAAYAGSFAILPEFKHILHGVELATTFNMNSSKMLLCGFDCSNMWIKDSSLLTNHLTPSADYLKKSNVTDFKDWQIPLGRNIKGLPLWMVIQQFGVEGIQNHLRNHVEAGKMMEKLVEEDKRLEIIARRSFGLVAFRAKGENELTDGIIQRLAENDEIFLLGSKSDGKSFIRLSPTNNFSDFSNIRRAFEIVKGYLDEVPN
jgi:tyrosine decarboxylase